MKYPVIRDSYRKPRRADHKHYRQGSPCIICGQLTVGGWWLQVNFLRGDDEIVRACDNHYKDKQTLIDAWLAAQREVSDVPSTAQRARCLQPRWSGFHAGDVTGTDTPPKETDQ